MARLCPLLLATGIAAAALLPALPLTAFAQAASPSPGRWSIHSIGPGESQQASLRFEYDGANSTGEVTWVSSWSSSIHLTETGLSAERLRGPAGPVSFQVLRAPGAFDCTGHAGGGSSAGEFVYMPDSRFDDALAARGMGRPTYRQSLALAAEGTTLAFVDRIRGSLPRASVADIVRIAENGVTPAYIADMEALGIREDAIPPIVRMRTAGVTPEFVRAVRAAGFGDLAVPQLVQLAQHGVSEQYIAGMRATGIVTTSAEVMLRLHDHGITPRYVGELASAGYGTLSPDELIALRNHGVSATFAAECAKAAHGSPPSVIDLIRLHDAAR
jgi:hypothetical protein